MAAGGTPGNVKLGAGRLYYAPLGTAEPTNCSTALPSAWIAVGYTEGGTSIDTAITSEDIEVAEELDPIDNVQTKRSTTLTLEMAETTKKRLLLALGGGASYADDSTPFEMPDISAIVGVQFVWDSLDTVDATNRRVLIRNAKPSGTVSQARRKAPQKQTIPATFNCTKNASGAAAVKWFPNSSGQV
jgi:hypothetical protein